MPPLLHPRSLPPGSTLGVCAPAGPVDDAALEAGIEWLEAEGYRVCCGSHIRERDGFLAGTDAQRLADLLEFVRDPQVDGIILARGGYGIARILRSVDPVELREARKLFVGYSDATSLLLFLRRLAGLAAIHGPMLERPGLSEASRRQLMALIQGRPEACAPMSGRPLRGGRAEGALVGGNLTVLVTSLGTPWEIDTDDAILFFEEVSEEPYAIDRLLTQLREAGKLSRLRGVAIGQLVGCESERYPEPTAHDVLREALAEQVEGPVVEDLPFGHCVENRSIGYGVRAELDGERGTLTLLESVVEDEV